MPVLILISLEQNLASGIERAKSQINPSPAEETPMPTPPVDADGPVDIGPAYFDWGAEDWPEPENPAADVLPDKDIERDEFLLLPAQQGGPGPQTQASKFSRNIFSHRALDDEDDTRYIINH